MEDLLKPIEWKGQVVITTAQLAEAYGTTTKNISGNFSRNKDRFIEGKHYFTLQGDELKEFMRGSAESGLPQYTSIAYLWTRRGASRHCKILGTDKAWEQFDYLEDNYFERQPKNIPLTTAQQIQLLAQGNVELNKRVDNLIDRMDKFELDLPILPIEADRITEAVRRKGVSSMGGKQSVAYQNRGLRQKVYVDIYHELKRQFSVRTYKAIQRKNVQKAIGIINGYNLPIVLSEAIDNINLQHR